MEFLIFLIMTISILVIPLAIAIYVFTGLALYKAAKLEGYNKKWLAWIPVIDMYLLFKLGNKNPKYVWLSIINLMLAIVFEVFIDNGQNYSGFLDSIFVILFIGTSIFIIVLTIQSYLYIANKYNINPAWFILGMFISIFSLVAYIIWFNKLRKLEKEKSDTEIFEIEE
ncbi:hypothetical protein GNF85_13715 [Clostridium perfringens]